MTMQDIFLGLDATRITAIASIIVKNTGNLVVTLICYCILRQHDQVNTGGQEMYPWPQDLESISVENVSSNFPANHRTPPAYDDPHRRIETPPPGQVTDTFFSFFTCNETKVLSLNERSLKSLPNQLRFSKTLESNKTSNRILRTRLIHFELRVI